MGPFGNEQDLDGNIRPKSSWYKDYSYFISLGPWFARGGHWGDGTGAGIFTFSYSSGTISTGISYRIILTPSK